MSASKKNRRKELSRPKPANPATPNNDSEEVVAELIKADPSLKTIGNKNLQKIAVAVQHTEFYSGQLPRPDHLEQFNNLIEDGAERIMKMTEGQSLHRIRTEKTVVGWTLFQGIAGQLFAFILAILFGVGGFYLTMHGHSVVGGTMIAAPVMGMIVAFLKYSNHHK